MIKLLIVDDEQTTREGLLEYIPWKDLGIDMVADAEDGAKALDLALQLQPDIVLTDVRMPRMNGIELAEQLKLKLPQCKVIFLSGYTDKEYLKSAIQLQALNYIEKPVDIEEVKEVMGQTVSLCKSEQEKKRYELDLISKVNESIPLLTEKLCLELITQNNSLESIKEKFDSIEIPFPESDNFVSVLIKLNLEQGKNTEVLQKYKEDLLKLISQRIYDKSLKCLCGFKESDYVLVHIYGENIKKQSLFQDMLWLIKEDIDSLLALGNKTFIGAGKSVRSVRNIPDSYHTAVIALQKQFFLGYNNIVFYQDESSLSYDFSQHNIQVFLDFLTNGKKSDSELFVKRIVHDLKLYNNTLINNIKNYFFKVLISLSKVCEERCIRLAESDNSEEFFWDVISKANTLYEIEDYILKKIEIFFKSMDEKENKKSIVLTIIKYIKDNYPTETLSIKDIANHTFLTPNYLSLVFKKETGKTINQFITETRIEKAKELLKDRRIRLYEISGSVGFSDANYFAKTFKKAEGLNPSEFREKYLS